jgi:hypothetical protein
MRPLAGADVHRRHGYEATASPTTCSPASPYLPSSAPPFSNEAPTPRPRSSPPLREGHPPVHSLSSCHHCNRSALTSGKDFYLTFRNYAAVTAIKATVQVNDVVATACASNPKVTFPGGIYPWIGAWAGLQGHFFNTATPTPGSMENDVVAGISMFRAAESTDPPDVLRVQSVVLHCNSWVCDTTLHHKDLGPVKRWEMARLRIQWDRDTHRFIFQRGDAPEVVAPYTVSDTAQPSAAVKPLVIANEVANCTAKPRPVAFIDTLFDDVMVNESAAPRGARSTTL